jgi:spore germination protein GerM
VTQTPEGVKVDLSQEFTAGGGSSSMIARLGQIIYTASSVDPNQPVWLLVEGTPLTVLGGEGLMVEQPLTRAQYEADFRGTGQ